MNFDELFDFLVDVIAHNRYEKLLIKHKSLWVANEHNTCFIRTSAIIMMTKDDTGRITAKSLGNTLIYLGDNLNIKVYAIKDNNELMIAEYNPVECE